MTPGEYGYRRFMELFAGNQEAVAFSDIPEEDRRDWEILATEMAESPW